MNVNELCHSIRFSDLSNDDLNLISNAIRYRRSMLTEEQKHWLRPGLGVKFTNSRNGRVYSGHVVKVNRKYVMVATGVQTWRVPATMLEKV